jgi:hypothetical protein
MVCLSYRYESFRYPKSRVPRDSARRSANPELLHSQQPNASFLRNAITPPLLTRTRTLHPHGCDHDSDLILPPIIALGCKSSEHTMRRGHGTHVLPLDQGQTAMLSLTDWLDARSEVIGSVANLTLRDTTHLIAAAICTHCSRLWRAARQYPRCSPYLSDYWSACTIVQSGVKLWTAHR